MIRKPDKQIFEIALNKVGLSSEAVWYCGDSIKNNVFGFKKVGLFPIFYQGKTLDETNLFENKNTELTIHFDYLHLHDWCEIIEILKNSL